MNELELFINELISSLTMSGNDIEERFSTHVERARDRMRARINRDFTDREEERVAKAQGHGQ